MYIIVEQQTPPNFGGGGHPGTTFSIIYQIKAYYFSCSKILFLLTQLSILRKTACFYGNQYSTN